jgi:hypothetical protein
VEHFLASLELAYQEHRAVQSSCAHTRLRGLNLVCRKLCAVTRKSVATNHVLVGQAGSTRSAVSIEYVNWRSNERRKSGGISAIVSGGLPGRPLLARFAKFTSTSTAFVRHNRPTLELCSLECRLPFRVKHRTKPVNRHNDECGFRRWRSWRLNSQILFEFLPLSSCGIPTQPPAFQVLHATPKE